jgi:SH3 domain-containing YSC84-like protein 1
MAWRVSVERCVNWFAGVSLGGSTLRPDNRANQKLYAKRLSAKDIGLKNEIGAPPSAEKLLATLNQKTSAKAVVERQDSDVIRP